MDTTSLINTQFNTWYFLVITHDVATGSLKMYLLKDGTTTPTQTHLSNVGTDVNLLSSQTNKPYLYVGSRGTHYLKARFFCYQWYRSAVDLADTVPLSQVCSYGIY